MLVDVLLIIMSVIIIRTGLKQGFLATIVSFIAWLAAAYFVLKYSHHFAQILYTGVVRDRAIKKVSATLVDDYAFGTTQNQFMMFLMGVSRILNSASGFIDVDTSQRILDFDPTGMSLEQVSRTITDSFLAPVLIEVCDWIVSIIGFAVLIAVFSSLGNMVANTIRITPLRSVDRLLGGVVGVLKAVVMVVVISFTLYALAGISQSDVAFKNAQGNSDKFLFFANAVDESIIIEIVRDKIAF